MTHHGVWPATGPSGRELAGTGCALPRIDTASSNVTTTAHNDDQLLVERLVYGDADAWQTFVHRYGRLVRARVADVASTFGRSSDESAIDDATAEVFAALLGNDTAALRAFEGRSSLLTYVAVIATRSATRGFARKQSVDASVSESALAQAACDPTMKDPVHQMIDAEQQQTVHRLLKRLPDKQRELVSLFHLQGKSYAEISETMELPIGSIGPTLRRAEAKLRQWMEGD